MQRIRVFNQIKRLFNNKNDLNIKRPMNPTQAESLGVKLSKEDLEILLNPLGFLSEEEKSQIDQNKQQEEEQSVKSEKHLNGDKEYGVKVKGPEPTRYGDWENKGRCTDF